MKRLLVNGIVYPLKGFPDPARLHTTPKMHHFTPQLSLIFANLIKISEYLHLNSANFRIPPPINIISERLHQNSNRTAGIYITFL